MSRIFEILGSISYDNIIRSYQSRSMYIKMISASILEQWRWH